MNDPRELLAFSSYTFFNSAGRGEGGIRKKLFMVLFVVRIKIVF
jgi:hypothetical protein